MTTDISLTGAQRLALIDLKDNATLSSRTQRRLSSGRKINSVVDDSVNYFKSKALEDRAKDFNNLKNEISQAVSHLQVTLEAITGLETILGQMKGILEASRSQSTAERQLANTSMKTLGAQFRELVNDASYGGSNLINSTTQGRTVRFGMRDSSRLELPGLDFLDSSDLGGRVFSDVGMFDADQNQMFMYSVLTAEMKTTKLSGVALEAGAVTRVSEVTGASFTTTAATPGNPTATPPVPGTPASVAIDNGVTMKDSGGNDIVLQAGDTLKSIKGGTLTHTGALTGLSLVNGVSSDDQAIASGDKIEGATVTVNRIVGGVSTEVVFSNVTIADPTPAPLVVKGETTGTIDLSTAPTIDSETFDGLSAIGEGNERVSVIDLAVARIEGAISRLRGHSQSLGSNVAILQAREKFTDQYVTLNTVGSEKYTLADLNQEGANLVALQTRQQLGIQSLAVAGQQQRAILTLLQ